MTLPNPPWSHMLDRDATGRERAHVDVTAERLMATPVDLISAMWDPQRCPAELLAVCAYNYSVLYLENDWPEQTKRDWIAGSYSFIAQRGKMPGVRAALAPNGYEVTAYVKAPQGTYASPEIEREVWNAYVRLLPEIRLTYGPRKGRDNGQTFCGDSFADADFAGVDDGPALFGRHGFMRYQGTDTPLRSIKTEISAETRQYTTTEQIVIDGKAGAAVFADDTFADVDFCDAVEVEARVLTFRITRDHVLAKVDFIVSTISPGFKPIDIVADPYSDIGKAMGATFADDAFADVDYALDNDGPYLLAESTYLFDPSIPPPNSIGVSFADFDRVSMPYRTIELMVDLHGREPYGSTFANDTFADATFAVPEDTRPIDKAMRAIEAARGHLDTTLVRFDAMRPVDATDTLTADMRIEKWVKNHL